MGSKSMDEASELLKAQAHIWNHIFNFINSMSLKCAVQLGIPDIIHDHGKPMILSQLVKALPISANKTTHVFRLMRILINSGFFTEQKVRANDIECNGYVLTRASKLLLKNDPMSLNPFLLAILDPILTNPWHRLSDWFKSNDATPFATTHGRTFWDYCGHDPALNSFFNEAMASDARLVTKVVIEKCKDVFEGLDSLVDVGGGTGTVAMAISEAFPYMECVNFDLPHVVDGLQGCEILKHVGGDMFESIPCADAVLLKWILHDWDDDECVKILKKARDAITTNKTEGKVIVIDMVTVTDDQNEDKKEFAETQILFDMLMMVLVTGRERNEQDWAKLFKASGFRSYKITPVLGLRSLIEVYP